MVYRVVGRADGRRQHANEGPRRKGGLQEGRGRSWHPLLERRSFDALFNGLFRGHFSSDPAKLSQLAGVKAMYPGRTVDARARQAAGSAPDLVAAINLTGASRADPAASPDTASRSASSTPASTSTTRRSAAAAFRAARPSQRARGLRLRLRRRRLQRRPASPAAALFPVPTPTRTTAPALAATSPASSAPTAAASRASPPGSPSGPTASSAAPARPTRTSSSRRWSAPSGRHAGA